MAPKNQKKRPAAASFNFSSPRRAKAAKGVPVNSTATPSACSNSPSGLGASPARSVAASKGDVAEEVDAEVIEVQAPEDQAGPLPAEYQAVAAAVESAPEFPEACRRMLVKMFMGSLGVAKEQRHRYQDRVVGMIGGILASIEADLRKAVDELEAIVSANDADRAACQRALAEADAHLAEEARNVAQAAARNDECSESLRGRAAVLTEATAALESAQAELAEARSKQSRLKSAETEAWGKLKDRGATGPDGQALLDRLMAVGREVGFDAALLDALPNALTMNAIARGAFYSHVNPQLDAEFPKRYQELVVGAVGIEATFAARRAAVQAAQAAHDALLGDERSSAAAKAAAQAAHSQVAAVRNAAQEAATAVPPVQQSVLDELPPARRRLEEFRGGALAAFESLSARQTPAASGAERPTTFGTEAIPKSSAAVHAGVGLVSAAGGGC